MALILLAIGNKHVLANTAQEKVPYDETRMLQLIDRCAPNIHPDTMLRVTKHESGFHPYIIGVNAKPREVFRFQTGEQAATKARQLIAEGKSIDMGLGQINSVNLDGLKMTPEQVFEPCENIRAAAFILEEAFTRTRGKYQDQRAALDQALSIYNTGKTDRGIANGYVGKVRAASYVVPALDERATVEVAAAEEAQADVPPPSWDVFANARYRGPRSGENREEASKVQKTSAASAAAVMLFGEP